MKKIYFLLSLVLMLTASVALNAQSNLTNKLLVNAGFDEQITYPADGEGANLGTADGSANCMAVHGWTPAGAGWTAGASFEYGALDTLNHSGGYGMVPTVGYNGSTGGALGVCSAWTGTVTYSQLIFLPAGSYTIEYAAYNAGPNVSSLSKVGWVPSSGESVLSSKVEFEMEAWETETLNFTLTETSSGNLQVGVSANNVGSGSTGRIFFDYITLVCNSIDRASLTALLAEAKELVSQISFPDDLNAAIAAVEAVVGEADNSEALIDATILLAEATETADQTVKLYELQDIVGDVITNHNSNNYTKEALQALEAIWTEIDNKLADNSIPVAELATYRTKLQTALDNYYASKLGLKVQYLFNDVAEDKVTDNSGSGYTGTLYNEASVVTMGKYNVLDLGNGTGYLDMGASLGNVFSTATNYTISSFYRVAETEELAGNGNFLCMFSQREANSGTDGPYYYFRMPYQKAVVSTGGWNNERYVQKGTAEDYMPNRGAWQHVVYRQTGALGELFVNGELVASIDTMYIPSEVMTQPTPYNWIARPAFSGDNYLKNTLLYDFRLYNQAISNTEIFDMAQLIVDLDKEYTSGAGNFSELAALITTAEATIAGVVIGDNAGQYSEESKATLTDAINVAKALVTGGSGSQPLINNNVAILQEAIDTFLGSVISDTNTLAEGEYFITVNGLYFTNPGVDVLANQARLSVANQGLQANAIITDGSQIHTLAIVDEVARYSIFSTVEEGTDEDTYFRHINEEATYRNDWGSADNNWRTFNILYNGDAYAIQKAGSAGTNFWNFDTSAEQVTISTATATYIFQFQTIAEVFAQEVTAGKAALAAATVGSGDNDYSQAVYNAFDAAIKTAEAALAGTATKDQLFAYGAAVEAFIPNGGQTNIDDVEKAKVSIYAYGNAINITTENPLDVAVYTFSGALVAKQTVNGSASIAVTPGLYIVKAGNHVVKVKN